MYGVLLNLFILSANLSSKNEMQNISSALNAEHMCGVFLISYVHKHRKRCVRAFVDIPIINAIRTCLCAFHA